jgi:hypothetical protein
MVSLSNDFILTLLITFMLGLHGGLRLRNDPEQIMIWTVGFKFPQAIMPLYGAAQVSAGIMSILLPEFGLPYAMAMASAEAFNHGVRQHNLPVVLFDLAVAGMALIVGLMKDVNPFFMLGGVCIGIMGWLYLHTRFPIRRLHASAKGK